MDTLPANIIELQLAIDVANTDADRPLSRRRVPVSTLTEIWRGQIALAPKDSPSHRALIAFLERRDGRVSPFGAELKSGFASRGANITGTLASVPAIGAGSITVTVTGAQTVRAGTLLTIGNIDVPPYQLCEVLADATGTGSLVLSIAPRIRYTFPGASAVAIGTVTGRFRMTADDISQDAQPGRGVVTLDVIEDV